MSTLEYNTDWNKIAEDPKCSQILRDFARTKLAENNIAPDQWKGYGLDPIWVETIESCERYGNPALSDSSMVKLAAKVLLLDEDSDGCTSVLSVMLPNGTRDTLRSYPKLVKACRKVIDETSILSEKSKKKKELAADANIVLASLLNLKSVNEGGQTEAEMYFKNALLFRPNDWRIHSAMSAMYMKGSKISLSLESISRAMELVKSPKASFELLLKKGKLLTQLSRTNEAISCLEKVMVKYELIKEELTDKDKGHALNAQYALCYNYSLSHEPNRYDNLLKHWKQAEAKRSKLSSDTIARLSWDFRDISQMAVAYIKPDVALSHRECHYCHKVTDDIKKCSACKVAVYCSKECQRKAWKSCHKLECSKMKASRKTEKKEMKKPKEAAKYIDEFLVPQNLYNKGVKLLVDGDPKEAAWNFLVSLFMDFSLDIPQNMPSITKCVDQCANNDLVAIVLGMVSNHDGDVLGKCERVLNTLSDHRVFGKADEKNFGGHVIYNTLQEVNRDSFAYGAALVFSARWKSRLFCLTRGVDRATNYSAFHAAAKQISDAKTFINKDQWLTFQFELGYSQYDIGAMEEGSYWLKLFVNNLNKIKEKNGNIAPHYQTYKASAEQKLKMIPMMKEVRDKFGAVF